jgi:hypothetical protein
MERLYVVTRQDLPPGAQLAQSCHAVSAFATAFPEEHRQWHVHGQNLVVLAVPDERALEKLFELIGSQQRLPVPFYEPDFDDALTAFAVSDAAAKLLSSLPLALRPPKAAQAAA